MTKEEIITACKGLQDMWYERNNQFKDWYNILLLEDTLKQEGLESIVSNEPRTFFNLALQLLISGKISHRFPVDGFGDAELTAATKTSEFITSCWSRHNKSNLRKGRVPWMSELIGFLLATGWYSVFSVVTEDEVLADVWNPAEVFPEYDEDGIIQVAHIYQLSAKAANRKIRTKGWKVSQPFTAGITVYNYWTITDEGNVMQALVMGNELVFQKNEPTLSRIPVYCAPVGGLPDRGSIITGSSWKRHIGESLFASNVGIYEYYNKQLTFLQQLLRDIAQPRWWEKSRTGGILKEENMFKRGAVFSMGLDENIGILPTSQIPIESRTLIMDTQNMMQKGSFPSALYGNLQQQTSSYLMSQITGSALSILKPYHEAVGFLIQEVDNNQLADIRKYNLQPYNFKLPKDLPPDIEIEVHYKIEIPGDVMQRANVAKMLNPQFTLSTATISDLFFPEISNPMAEQARANRDRALQHPIYLNLALLQALRNTANSLRHQGDDTTAILYDKAAAQIEAALAPVQQTQVQTAPRMPPIAISQEMATELPTIEEGLEGGGGVGRGR